MRPTSSLLGASRLPLTTKRANKDFYKGTRQAYVPGGGHRTGPPGKFVVKGKSKYRLVDEQVRFFVGPGVEAMRNTELKPYVAANTPLAASAPKRFANFAPRPPKVSSVGIKAYRVWNESYNALSPQSRDALLQSHRRKWYRSLMGAIHAHSSREGLAGESAADAAEREAALAIEEAKKAKEEAFARLSPEEQAKKTAKFEAFKARMKASREAKKAAKRAAAEGEGEEAVKA